MGGIGAMKRRHGEVQAVKDSIEKQCRAGGLRPTRQRRLIDHILSEAGVPLEFAELYRRVAARNQRVSRATVYRTLRLFKRAGLIEDYVLADGRCLYGYGQGGHHDHLIDMETGKVSDFVDAQLDALLENIAQRLGYKLVDHRLELYAMPKTQSAKRAALGQT